VNPHPALPRRTLLLVAGAAMLGVAGGVPAPAQANEQPLQKLPPELLDELPGARLQGSGRLRFMGFQVYDARLWTGRQAAGRDVVNDWGAAPLALELQYLRSFDGHAIAERSLAEMKRQGEIAADTAERWLQAMKQLFPDVRSGDRILGVSLPGHGAKFYVNGALKGEIRDAEFARRFFGVWLSPSTSQPAMRESLLGAPPSSAR
jgi:hypothetical protein